MTINLNDVNTFPEEVLDLLSEQKELLSEITSFDRYRDYKELAKIIKMMDEECERQGIYGFHYTRVVRKEIEEQGLRVRSGSEIREVFLKNYGYLFNPQQLKKIGLAYSKYYSSLQTEARDGVIYFTLRHYEAINSDVKRFLSFYGGEQVHAALMGSDILSILESIGEPFVLKCKLNLQDVEHNHPYSSYGTVAVSTYHKSIDAEVVPLDLDIRQTKDLNPSNIEFLSI